jgi:HPt (histidine-containing phosphotransfer) domain-containing protein
MIELFMEQCPGDIEKLTILIKTDDYSGIGSMAHRLQTSLALMGFNSNTITKLKQIESLCTTEQNINEVKHLTNEVINDCKFMLEKFSGQLNELNQVS